MGPPIIINQTISKISQYLSISEKQVQFDVNKKAELYHSIVQSDYVGILAITDKGKIPIIRQYRPAVESFTWEFPAGTIDEDDNPLNAASRELQEETGLTIKSLHPIGTYFPDTGRLSFRSFGFFAVCHSELVNLPEDGIEVRYVTLNELLFMIKTGEFNHQLHIALLTSAIVHKHLDSKLFSL
jgi:8-oxo-dGTP pyrophosphatase MutT (NUDIX family)